MVYGEIGRRGDRVTKPADWASNVDQGIVTARHPSMMACPAKGPVWTKLRVPSILVRVFNHTSWS